MKFFFISIMLAATLISCDETLPKEKTVFVTDTTRVQDTVIFIKDSTMAYAFADSLPAGAYQGIFPCKGCEGIQQTVVFSPDKKYIREEMTWGSQALPKRIEGQWDRKDGKIWLYAGGKPEMKFLFKKDTLLNVEANTVPVRDSLHFLTRRNLAADQSTWKQKQSEGIDFIGVGNEPFWTLEIDNEKLALFKLADWQKPVIIPIEKPMITTDSTFYSLPFEKERLNITILSRFCNDGMSDLLYQNKVTVRFKGAVYKGCGVALGSNFKK